MSGMARLAWLASAVLALVLAVAASSPAVARAGNAPDDTDPAQRVLVRLKSVYVSNDHDIGKGEFSATLALEEYIPPCAPHYSTPSCSRTLLAASGIRFDANDGDVVQTDVNLVKVGKPTSGTEPMNEWIGIPLRPGMTYAVSLRVWELDAVEHDDLGMGSVMLTGQNGWGRGTQVLRAMRNNGQDPGDFSAEIEIYEPDLPDLRPVALKSFPVPGSQDRRVCVTVQNAGVVDVGTFQVGLRADGRALANGRLDGGVLGSGSAKELCGQVAVPANAKRLMAFADDLRVTNEVVENNNTMEVPYVK